MILTALINFALITLCYHLGKFSAICSKITPTAPMFSVIYVSLCCSMLNERRIIITSKKMSKLTACCHAAASLLYPCYWQHLFIPVLPAAVIEMVS